MSHDGGHGFKCGKEKDADYQVDVSYFSERKIVQHKDNRCDWVYVRNEKVHAEVAWTCGMRGVPIR